MDKGQMENERKTGNDYVPPKIEVYTTEGSTLLAGTTIFEACTHEDGNTDILSTDGGGTHADGRNTVVTGAKILGREFNFSDVWEE